LEINGKYKITQQRRSQEGKAYSSQEGHSQSEANCSARFPEAQSKEDGARHGEAVGEEALSSQLSTFSLERFWIITRMLSG
jgi:hypothetical protein